MKHFLIVIILFFFAASAFGQTVFTAGLTYTNGAPTHNPGSTGSRYAIDTVTFNLYIRSYTNTWTLIGNNWPQNISGCSAPAYTPTKHQSRVVINACNPPELYIYDGAAWDQIGGAAGITGTGLTNRLAYWTASGAIGYESTLVVDTVNNRLMIGSQTAPTATLDVTGAASGSNVKGAWINSTLTATANNDAYAALQVDGTFVPGAFTGTRPLIAAFVGSTSAAKPYLSFYQGTSVSPPSIRFYRNSGTSLSTGTLRSSFAGSGLVNTTTTYNEGSDFDGFQIALGSSQLVAWASLLGTGDLMPVAPGQTKTVSRFRGLIFSEEVVIGSDNDAGSNATGGTLRSGHKNNTGTNTGGSNLTIQAGRGNGNSTLGGNIIFQTPSLEASGTTYQTYATVATATRTNRNFLIGGTTDANARLDVNGSGATSTTDAANFANSNDSTILRVRNDRRVGINTATPSRDMDVNGEARIRDLTTDTPTRLVGADADGDLGDAGSVGAGRVAYGGGNYITSDNSFLYDETNNALSVTRGVPTGSVGSTFYAGKSLTIPTTTQRYHTFAAKDTITSSASSQTFVLFGSRAFGGGTPVLNIGHSGCFVAPYEFYPPTINFTGAGSASRNAVVDISGGSSYFTALGVANGGATNTIYVSSSAGINYFSEHTGASGVLFQGRIAPSAATTGKSSFILGNARTDAGNGMGIAYRLATSTNATISNYFYAKTHDVTNATYTSGFITEAYDNGGAVEVMRTHGKHLLIGHTTNGNAEIDVNGSGATSATDVANFANSNDSTILRVRNDRRVGINTATPDVSFDAGDNTDQIKLPGGTTAQRAAVNNSIRYNSDVEGFEARENGIWFRLTSSQAPSIAAGAAAGTGPTVAIGAGSNDLGGTIEITTGTSTTTGTLATITYGDAFDASLSPHVTITPANDKAAEHMLQWYKGTSGNSSFILTSRVALDASTLYVFTYQVQQ